MVMSSFRSENKVTQFVNNFGDQIINDVPNVTVKILLFIGGLADVDLMEMVNKI